MCLYGTGLRSLKNIRSTIGMKFSIQNIDETVIQIGDQHFWLWFCIETIHHLVRGIYISEEIHDIC
jgi:transposase-like protein